jgi:undecaprenyl-diphosphatase
MLSSTRMGDGWLWVSCGLLLWTRGATHLRTLGAGLLAAGLASLTFMLLKRRIRRPRPCDRAPHPAFADVRAPDRYSFPSGHTINAFALAALLCLRHPGLAGLLLPVAASIGASRVVLGLHYASDVVAGAVLGGLIGSCVYILLLA